MDEYPYILKNILTCPMKTGHPHVFTSLSLINKNGLTMAPYLPRRSRKEMRRFRRKKRIQFKINR